MNVKSVVPFFCVADMQRSLRYYVDGLGFTMTNQWIVEEKIRWCWLELEGAALMLQEAPATPPLGNGVALYFICEDAKALYSEFKSRGLSASKPQIENNMWVTNLIDPDGYRIHFESDVARAVKPAASAVEPTLPDPR